MKKIKPSVAIFVQVLCCIERAFQNKKLILQFTIYNNLYVTTKEVRIYTEMHRFLRCFFSFFCVNFSFSSHTKKGGKALLHYKGLQMYNYTVRRWPLLGYIIDTDSTSKTRKTTKFYIYIYIYMQRSTPSIHVIFIEARPETNLPC